MKMDLRVKLLGAAAAVVLLSGMIAIADSPVADAAMRGDMAAVQSLIKKGADVNAPQGDGMTALHWAAERGNAQLVGLLLKAKANHAAGTRIGRYTPLHLASQAADPVIVDLLLKAGSDANAATTSSGVTPLHLAAASGDPKVVLALIEHGAKVDAREPEFEQTPLMFAASYNRAEAVKVLLSKGADANLVTRTIVLRELTQMDAEATRLRTAKLNELKGDTSRRVEGTPAQLQEAIRVSREAYVKSVTITDVSAERDTTLREPGQAPPPTGLVSALGGLTALHHAAREGSVEAVKALIAGGAKLDIPSGGDKTTALLMATLNGQFDAAMLIIAAGANPNLVSEAGTSPLYGVLERRWANRTRYPQPIVVDYQKTGYLEVMEALLKAKANPNVRLNRHLYYMTYTGCGNSNCGLETVAGATAFWRAAYATDVEAMRLLARYGADPMMATQRIAAAGGGGGGGGRGGGGGGGGRGGAGGGRGGGRGAGAAGTDSTAGAASAGAGGAVVAAAAGGRAAAGGAGAAATMAGAAGGRAAATPADTTPPKPVDVAFPIHATAGVGYGQGFAGNSHRHAPDGWLPSTKFLIEELKIDINLRDANGYTALHHAAARGDIELIKYLVSKGADVKAESNRGQTTADMANGPVSRITPYPEAVKLLESLGSKNNHRCASCE